MVFYYEEKDIKHLVKQLKPLVKRKINWCKTGVIVSKEDNVIKRLVSDLEYMLEHPDHFKDKHNVFECVCTLGTTCCECGKELIEDEFACAPEPCADEMHDYYIIHRRCFECERKKLLQARDFIINFDDPFQYKRSIAELCSIAELSEVKDIEQYGMKVCKYCKKRMKFIKEYTEDGYRKLRYECHNEDCEKCPTFIITVCETCESSWEDWDE